MDTQTTSHMPSIIQKKRPPEDALAAFAIYFEHINNPILVTKSIDNARQAEHINVVLFD